MRKKKNVKSYLGIYNKLYKVHLISPRKEYLLYRYYTCHSYTSYIKQNERNRVSVVVGKRISCYVQ
jgi:hypothetical protein